jgi:epsilon-lactone hydrolase
MQSLKSKIILGLLKHRHLFKLQLRQKPFDNSIPGIMKLRQETDKAGFKFGKLPTEITISPLLIGKMYAEWVNIQDAAPNKAILYFHGGMYLIGSPRGHRIHVTKFVAGTKINALVFDYGLAPENPFPKGLNDAVEAYSYLLESGFNPKDIVFAGDSAGGGLCLATLLALKQKDLPMPAAAAVLSPWTDLTLSGESYKKNEKTCLSPRGSAECASDYYSGSVDRRNPLISPIFGELEGLPPLHISVGDQEILFDDGCSFARKAEAAGVETTLLVGKGMCHCYPAFGKLFPEAHYAMNQICSFLKKHIY